VTVWFSFIRYTPPFAQGHHDWGCTVMSSSRLTTIRRAWMLSLQTQQPPTDILLSLRVSVPCLIAQSGLREDNSAGAWLTLKFFFFHFQHSPFGFRLFLLVG
jgi:hypothetical protein